MIAGPLFTLLCGLAGAAADYDQHHHGRYNRTAVPQKRLFNEDIAYSAVLGLQLDASIPIPDADTSIYISVPYYYDFAAAGAARRGRSLAGGDSARSGLYRQLEGYLAQVVGARAPGAGGHDCLLRAMCEASAAPLHQEGLLGDAVNFLLTANYAGYEKDDRFQSYRAAQSRGQLAGDCSLYHPACPVSLFTFLPGRPL